MSFCFKEVKDFTIRKIYSRNVAVYALNELYESESIEIERRYVESFNDYICFIEDPEVKKEEERKFRKFLFNLGNVSYKNWNMYMPPQYLKFLQYNASKNIIKKYPSIPYFIEFLDDNDNVIAYTSLDHKNYISHFLTLENPQFYENRKIFIPFYLRYHPEHRNLIHNQSDYFKYLAFENFNALTDNETSNLIEKYPPYFIDEGFCMQYNGKNTFSRIRNFYDVLKKGFTQEEEWVLNFWIKIPSQQEDLRGSFNTIIEQWSGERKGYRISICLYNDNAGGHKHKVFARIFNGLRGYLCWSHTPIPENTWTMISLRSEKQINGRNSYTLYINGVNTDTTFVLDVENTFNASDLYVGASVKSRNKSSDEFSSDIIVSSSFLILNARNYSLSEIEEYYEISEDEVPDEIINTVLDDDEEEQAKHIQFFLSPGGFFKGEFANLSFFTETDEWEDNREFSWLLKTLENRFVGVIARNAMTFQISNKVFIDNYWSRVTKVRLSSEIKRNRIEVIAEVNPNEFICSTNPTCLDINEKTELSPKMRDEIKNTYATQIGLYDDYGNLLVIGKLNFPVKLGEFQRTFLVPIDLYEEQE